jgi:signal transduction histidine kinase
VVANLHDLHGVGSLESALAAATSDPDLRVSYWLPALGTYSDAHGRPVRELSTRDGIVATQVMRSGERIAVISHTGDAAELERVLGSDLRLALDNERLQAEVLAQMSDLRDSRARIVEAGDEGRRRLERDLHDGAQQSLLGLSYELRVARTAAATKPHSELTALLDSALVEVGEAFAELRELAHGIFPAVLTQAGLCPAVAALTEISEIPVELNCNVTGRLPTAVETAVYVLVADGLSAAAEGLAASTTVTIARREGHVAVHVMPDRADVFTDMARVKDRVGAVGGTLHVDAAGLRAEIPCAS